MSESSRRDPGALWLWGTAAISAIVALAAWLVIHTEVAGVYHDDAIYLSVAKGLAEGNGYHLVNLPGVPWQTKYPFLLSSLLAVLWKIWPDFPANLWLLKLPQVISLAACAWFATRWYATRFGQRDPLQFVCGLLVVTLPGVVMWVDLTLTELPFLALCLAAFYVAESADPTRPGKKFGPGRALLLGGLVGAACLLRQAAVPLILAGLIVSATAARRRLLTTAAFVLPVTALLGPWVGFRASASLPSNPLLSYYTTYEPSALEIGLSAGIGSALTIVIDNVAYLWQAIEGSLLLAEVPLLRTLVYPLLLVGAWRWGTSARTTGRFSTVFLVLYTALLLCWPWHPARYSLPLLVTVAVLFTAGTAEVSRRVGAHAASFGFHPKVRIGSWIPIGFVLILAVSWSAYYFRSDRVWGLGTRSSWTGFEETFEWVRTNTPPDALLATPYDPMFYLYTERRGVRPWFHRPWTYFYPRGAARPDIGEAAAVRTALDDLGIRYLIVSHLEAYTEEEAYEEMVSRLLEQYGSDLYPEPPALRFESTDGRHRVYELPN